MGAVVEHARVQWPEEKMNEKVSSPRMQGRRRLSLSGGNPGPPVSIAFCDP